MRFTLLLLTCLSFSATAMTITGVQYEGKGCPAGSAFVNLSDDGRAMTLGFDQFLAELESRVFDRTECNIKLNVLIPEGEKLGLFCVEHRGFASTDYEVGAEVGSFYRFGNKELKSFGSRKLEEGINDDFSLLGIIPNDEILWSKCGGQTTLDLKTVALIYANHFGRGKPRGWRPLDGSTQGVLAVDSVDGSFKVHYGITSKPCDPQPCQETPTKHFEGAGVISNIVKQSDYNRDGSLNVHLHTNIAWDAATHQKVCEMAGYKRVTYAKKHRFSSCRDDNVAIYRSAADKFEVLPGCRHRAMVKRLTCAEPINPCGN